jgi:hypothetical protein
MPVAVNIATSDADPGHQIGRVREKGGEVRVVEAAEHPDQGSLTSTGADDEVIPPVTVDVSRRHVNPAFPRAERQKIA